METNWFSLIAALEILFFVGVYTFLLHKNKIRTSALLDKITITIIFSSIVGLITSILLILGVNPSEKHIVLFHFIQVISMMVIGTCLGIGFNQKIKNLKRLERLGDKAGIEKLLNNFPSNIESKDEIVKYINVQEVQSNVQEVQSNVQEVQSNVQEVKEDLQVYSKIEPLLS